MGNKKGGGIGSRATNAPTTYFTGQPSTRINPKGVSQVGQSIGNHATDSGRMLRGGVEPVRQGAMGGVGSVPLGNQTSLEAGQGPGSGRQVHACGSQQGLRSPAPIGPTRDTLAEFGNDSPNVKGR